MRGGFLFSLTPDPFFLFYNLRLVALAASQFKRRTEEIVLLHACSRHQCRPNPNLPQGIREVIQGVAWSPVHRAVLPSGLTPTALLL